MADRPRIETLDGRILPVGCLPEVEPDHTRQAVYQLVGVSPDVATIACNALDAKTRIRDLLKLKPHEKLPGSGIRKIREL